MQPAGASSLEGMYLKINDDDDDDVGSLSENVHDAAAFKSESKL